MPRYQITLTNRGQGRYVGLLADLQNGYQIRFPDCSKHRQGGRSVITGHSAPDLPDWFLEMTFIQQGLFSILLNDPFFQIEFAECELDETGDAPAIIGWTDTVHILNQNKKDDVA